MKRFNFDLNMPIESLTALFNAGMDRNLPFIIPIPTQGKILNLGAGEKKFPWASELQLPIWDAEYDRIPCQDEEVDAIIAFHFFEHLMPYRLIFTLNECARVMKNGATLTTVVPHRLGGIAYQDITHRCFFTEESWRTLLKNEYYDTQGLNIRLKLHFNLIMGDSERTLCLFSQFIKEP